MKNAADVNRCFGTVKPPPPSAPVSNAVHTPLIARASLPSRDHESGDPIGIEALGFAPPDPARATAIGFRRPKLIIRLGLRRLASTVVNHQEIVGALLIGR